jgi:short-subunit dehydrogenase
VILVANRGNKKKANKTISIIGTTNGIGTATAAQLATMRHAIVIVDRNAVLL